MPLNWTRHADCIIWLDGPHPVLAGLWRLQERLKLQTPEEKSLGQRLIEVRKEFGWSQEDAARFLDTTQATISRIENVDYTPSPLVRRIISDFLKMVAAGMVRASDLPPKPDKTDPSE